MVNLTFFIVTTNTIEGIYKKSDFINEIAGRFWKKSDTSAPSTVILTDNFNFDASDNSSEIVIQLSQFLNNNANRITHIVAETSSRYIAYSVLRIEYLNDKQLKYHLVEDEFLSHINTTLNSKMLITRSNDESKFFVNDTADVSFGNVRSNIDSGFKDLTGKWMLYTYLFKAEDLENEVVSGTTIYNSLNIKYRKLNKADYENFSTYFALTTKYPNIYTYEPNTFDYFNKICFVTETDELYQAQYLQDGSLRWEIIDFDKTYLTDAVRNYGWIAEITKNQTIVGPSVSLMTGDVLTLNIAFPLADNLYAYCIQVVGSPSAYAWQNITSNDRVEKISGGNNVDLTPFLKSKRIISGLNLGEEGSFRPTNDSLISEYRTYIIAQKVKIIPNIITVAGASSQCPLILPQNMQTIQKIDVSQTITSQTSEPFVNYFLSAWGKEIPIKARLLEKPLYVKSSIGSVNWDILVYSDNLSNIIHAESLQYSVPYSIDKYDEFLAQNSTYIQAKWVNTILGTGGKLLQTAGAAGIAKTFSAVPNVGGINASAALSVAGTVVNAAQTLINADLRERAMQNAPDTMVSGNSEYGQSLLKPFSVFMYKNEPYTLAKNIMTTSLELRGFPTYFVATPNDLSYQSNSTYGRCKVFAGRLLEMSYNFHITNKINNKLANTIVLLE